MKQTEGQLSFENYELKQVEVRLKLRDAPSLYSQEPLSSPQKAVDVMAKMMADLDREYCCVINLNNKLQAISSEKYPMDQDITPLSFNIVSIGTLNTALVPIQNVFKAAILSNAGSVVLMHNHPSGALMPSKEDIKLTKQVIAAGHIMGIPVMDHIIVGGENGGQYSFRESTDLFNQDPMCFLIEDAKRANEKTVEYRTDDNNPSRHETKQVITFGEKRSVLDLIAQKKKEILRENPREEPDMMQRRDER